MLRDDLTNAQKHSIRRRALELMLDQVVNFNPRDGVPDPELYAGLVNAFPSSKKTLDRYILMKRTEQLFPPTVGRK